jgi:hypothetical protein
MSAKYSSPHFEIQGNTIYCSLPDGIEISENKYGKCLRASNKFAKDDFMYRGCMKLMDEKEVLDEYDLVISNRPNEVYKLRKDTHCVLTDDKMQIYGFDAFTNHSCDPNVICLNMDGQFFDAVALRDIQVGDEITGDYALFDYGDDGQDVECECGSVHCRGRIQGFKHLPLETQLKLLPQIYEKIREEFERDHPELNLSV